jgi:hypothetical protein
MTTEQIEVTFTITAKTHFMIETNHIDNLIGIVTKINITKTSKDIDITT